MGYYKIQNITNSLAKRHPKANSIQRIGFKTTVHDTELALLPGEEKYIECQYVPIVAQKLRNEGLITIVEVDKNSYHNLLNQQEQTSEVKSDEPANVVENDEKSKKVVKKRG